MEIVTNLTERNYARQHSVLVNTKYALSRAEIDLVLVLLTAIHKDDKDFKTYEFTIKDLELKTDRQWNSKQLKDTIRSLMSKPLELPANTKKGWAIVNWFTYFSYEEGGLISCRFEKALKPYLLDIQGRFILGDVRHLLPMKSSYSKRIYLLLKEYQKFGVRKFEVIELMKILKVPKSLNIYNNFKQKVLDRAKADINKFTDINISYDEKKIGRKVNTLTFHIKKNDEDLKTFISSIRELYPNQSLYEGKDGRMFKCSDKGLLYYADDALEWLDKNTAQKAWEWLHENRAKLYCFTADLFSRGES